MEAIKIIFWLSFAIIFYTYFGYGILVFFINLFRKLSGLTKNRGEKRFVPNVSLVIAAYNEEDFIHRKIENTIALDYPAEKLQVIFVTDGSKDNTPAVIREKSNFIVLHQPEREGKVAAVNRAVNYADAPVIIFCDANTLLNREAIREIVKHYEDPKVGGVAGEKKIMTTTESGAAASGEGLYWKYESWLKKMDSELYTVVGAAGELFSIRKELFEKVPTDTIIEDFVLSLKICLKGYVVRYEPLAFAVETGSESIKDEQKRKVRICAGGFQAMLRLTELLNIFRFPVLSFQYISHRVLRWAVTPLCIVLLLISNVALVKFNGGVLYSVFLFLQLFFYCIASIGWILTNRKGNIKFLNVPYYFLFMNISVFLGFARFIRRKQSVLWEKAARQKVV